MTFEEVMVVTRTVSSSVTFSDIECAALYSALVQVSGTVVEVGCQLGRSSSVIAQVQKERGFHCIHIDPYTEQPQYAAGWLDMMLRLGDRDNHAFCLLCMRTDQAEWLLSKIGEIDLAFIDGDHEFASVMMDLFLIGDRVRRGGYLLAHDYDNEIFPGVKQALDSYMDIKWHLLGVEDTMGVWIKK